MEPMLLHDSTLGRIIVEWPEFKRVVEKKSSDGNITSSIIRQALTTPVKELIARQNPSMLGEICALGKNFDPGERREAALMVKGENGWCAIYLSASNDGLMLLQKIAAATLLVTITHTIHEIQPPAEKAHGKLLLEDMFDADELIALHARKLSIAEQINW